MSKDSYFIHILDLCGCLNKDELENLIGCIETMIENMEEENDTTTASN